MFDSQKILRNDKKRKNEKWFSHIWLSNKKYKK